MPFMVTIFCAHLNEGSASPRQNGGDVTNFLIDSNLLLSARYRCRADQHPETITDQVESDEGEDIIEDPSDIREVVQQRQPIEVSPEEHDSADSE
jgi:hypothetical protein